MMNVVDMYCLYIYTVHGDAVHIQEKLHPFMQKDLGLCTCQSGRSFKIKWFQNSAASVLKLLPGRDRGQRTNHTTTISSKSPTSE